MLIEIPQLVLPPPPPSSRGGELAQLWKHARLKAETINTLINLKEVISQLANW